MRSRQGKGNFLAFNKEEEEWVTIQSTLSQQKKTKEGKLYFKTSNNIIKTEEIKYIKLIIKKAVLPKLFDKSYTFEIQFGIKICKCIEFQ